MYSALLERNILDMFKVTGNKINFEIGDKAEYIKWYAKNLPLISKENSDFWRIHIDNGVQREITVYSSDQTGIITAKDDGIEIFYDTLVDENKNVYDIKLTVAMKGSDDYIECFCTVNNQSYVRVNEVQAPFIDLLTIADENKSSDTLYRPYGIGQKIPDVWNWAKKQHTEYMSADYNGIWAHATYPSPMSMAFLGIESKNHFLYLGRHDEKFRTCCMSVGASPRGDDDRLMLAVSQYPAVISSETIECGHTFISLMEGGWQEGSMLYEKWARESWFASPKIPDWINNMTGWQRIIMKHQYGEIFFKYDDLPRLYKEGAKFGLDTLLVFGWWKGCFDNNYPIYEVDDELGGEEALKKAITEIQTLGGRVILYNNGVLMDVATDYYKNIGHKISKKNINNVEYREFYQFSNNGTLLRNFGYKSFASACNATDEWKERLIKNAKQKLSFKPDSLFFDQMGGSNPIPCFDTSHKHKQRCDAEAIYKIENAKAVGELLDENTGMGTEIVVDAFTPYFHYYHGLWGSWYDDLSFPPLYRSVFPETIITNRLIHDEKEGFKKHLNFAFVNGLRFDVSVYRGRMMGISGLKEYSSYIKYLLELKDKYHKFFYEGKFTGSIERIAKKYSIWANHFESNDGENLCVFWNDTDEQKVFDFYDTKIKLETGEVSCYKF